MTSIDYLTIHECTAKVVQSGFRKKFTYNYLPMMTEKSQASSHTMDTDLVKRLRITSTISVMVVLLINASNIAKTFFCVIFCMEFFCKKNMFWDSHRYGIKSSILVFIPFFLFLSALYWLYLN